MNDLTFELPTYWRNREYPVMKIKVLRTEGDKVVWKRTETGNGPTVGRVLTYIYQDGAQSRTGSYPADRECRTHIEEFVHLHEPVGDPS